MLSTIKRRDAAAGRAIEAIASGKVVEESTKQSGSDGPAAATTPEVFMVLELFTKSPGFVLLLLQVLISISIAAGSQGPRGLQLATLTGMPQLAWAGCVWLLWLTCVMCFFVYRIVERNGLHLDSAAGATVAIEGAEAEAASGTGSWVKKLCSAFSAANLHIVFCSCVAGQGFFSEIADAVKENMDQKGVVGAFIVLIWLAILGSAMLASYLTNLWVMTPLVTLLPPAAGIFYNFLQAWEKAGCPVMEVPVLSSLPPAAAAAGTTPTPTATTLQGNGWTLHNALRSWQLALMLLVLGVGLACVPKQFYIMAIYLGLWLLAAACTAITVARWRCTLTVDRILVAFIGTSWVPTVVWSIICGSISGKAVGASTVIMPLMAGTTLQMMVLCGVIWNDCMQMTPSEDISTASLVTPKTLLRILVSIIAVFVFIMLSLFTAYVSTPLGVALIMLFSPMLVVVAVKLDVIQRENVCIKWLTEHYSIVTYGREHQALLCGLLIFCVMLSGLLGALAHPSHAFWWATFAWLSLAFASLVYGLVEYYYCKPKIYGAMFYPVYTFSQLGNGNTTLENVSLRSSFILIFFIMLTIWAVWCSIIIMPAEGGLILFVVSITSTALYVRLVSRGLGGRRRVDAAILERAKTQGLISIYGDSNIEKAAVTINAAAEPSSPARSAALDVKIRDRLGERARALEVVTAMLAMEAGVFSPMSPVPFINLFAFCTKTAEEKLPDKKAKPSSATPFGSTTDSPLPQTTADSKRHSAIKGMVDNPLAAKARESDLRDVALSNDLERGSMDRDSIPSFVEVAATTTDEKTFFDLIDAHMNLLQKVSALNKFQAFYLLRAYAESDNDLNSKVAALLAFLRDQFRTVSCATTQASIQISGDPSGIEVGCAVSGPGIPDGTVVCGIDKNKITISTTATATNAAAQLQFTSLFFCKNQTFVNMTAEDHDLLRFMTPSDLMHSLPPLLLQGLLEAYQSYQGKLEHKEALEREEKRRQDQELKEREAAKRRKEQEEFQARAKAKALEEAQAKARAIEEAMAREKKAAEERERELAAEIAAMKKRMDDIAHEDEERQAADKKAAAAEIARKEEEARKVKASAEKYRLESEARLAAQKKKDEEEAIKKLVKVPSGGAATGSVMTRFGGSLGDSLRSEIDKVMPKGKVKFVDVEFDMSTPAGIADVLGSDELRGRHFTTMRLGDLLGSDKINSLPGGGVYPAVTDVKQVNQGQLGDCYFIAAIATLAERPALVKKLKLFPVGQQHMDIGLYAVGLFFNGKYRTVIVDDLIPCSGRSPAFASGAGCGGQPHHALWVMLLEKAYAKVHGNYQALEGGNESLAMEDLTGGVPGSLDNLKDDMDGNWQRIRLLFEGGHLLGAGSTSGKDTDTTSEGIVKGHAYSILQVRLVEGSRLMQMRNPWGRGEWKGAWSDNAPQWTPRMRKLLNCVSADDGAFWICFEDFVRVFRAVYLCRLFEDNILNTQGEGGKDFSEREGVDKSPGALKFVEVRLEGPEYAWKKDRQGGLGTAGGCANSASFSQNPQFLLSCTEDCNVTIVLAQTEDLVGKVRALLSICLSLSLSSS